MEKDENIIEWDKGWNESGEEIAQRLQNAFEQLKKENGKISDRKGENDEKITERVAKDVEKIGKE